jgi:hypothetical protein
MDIPLGNPHISLRPEIVFVLQIRGNDLSPLKRLAGGIAIAVNGPSPKKLRRMKKEKAAAKKAAAEDAVEPSPPEAELNDEQLSEEEKDEDAEDAEDEDEGAEDDE